MDYKKELVSIIATLLDGGTGDIEVFYKTPHADPVVIMKCGKVYKKYQISVSEL